MVESLQTRATDVLIDQLLERIGDDARVVRAGGRLGVLDSVYVGALRDLLEEAFPDTPSELFHRVRSDWIVVSRDLTPPDTKAVRYDESRLRVPKLSSDLREAWTETYGALTGAEIVSTRHLDADLHRCTLVFDRRFFRPKSIVGWARLARTFARMTAAWVELKRESGLRQNLVENEGSNSHQILSRLVEMVDGEEIELELEPV
jgi:hypothetical protein